MLISFGRKKFSTRARAWRMILCLLLLSFLGLSKAQAEDQPWSQRMADATIKRWPEGNFLSGKKPWEWNYELVFCCRGWTTPGIKRRMAATTNTSRNRLIHSSTKMALFELIRLKIIGWMILL